jgi:putative hydroxymethylpyrimidine transport system substrate-binding protein
VRVLALLVVVAVASIPACGSGTPLSVCLDYLPNPNHVPLYTGLDAGAFAARGLDVDLLVPGNPSDPVKLVAARAVDIALTPQINYLMARAEGLPLVAIGVLIDHSLGGLLAIADRGVTTLADLAGRPIGYSLAPLEPALWRTMLACAGVEDADVDLVNVGFNTVAALLMNSVDAVGAFRNVEAIQVELVGRQPVFFAQEDFCAPETYDLVLVAHPDLIRERGADVAAFLDGLQESIDATRRSPDDALAAFFRAFPELDDEVDRRSFAATLPLYADDVRLDDPAIWEEVQRFLVDAGLVSSAVPFESLVVTDLAPLTNP